MRALVTGGSGRVGSAIASTLERAGWSVLAAGRLDGDLAVVRDAKRLVERAAAELGGLDLLVNAARGGIAPQPVEGVAEGGWGVAFGATAKGGLLLPPGR